MEQEPTGNAYRELSRGVEIGPRNLILKLPEADDLESLVDEVGEGILVREVLGAHSSNPASGLFSVVAPVAYVFKGGELIGSVKQVGLTGLFGDVLQNVLLGGGGKRQVGFLVAPYVAVEGVNVVL